MQPDALIWYPPGQVCKFDTGPQVPSIFLWYPTGQPGNNCLELELCWMQKQYHNNRSNTAYGYNHLHYTIIRATGL